MWNVGEDMDHPPSPRRGFIESFHGSAKGWRFSPDPFSQISARSPIVRFNLLDKQELVSGGFTASYGIPGGGVAKVGYTPAEGVQVKVAGTDADLEMAQWHAWNKSCDPWPALLRSISNDTL